MTGLLQIIMSYRLLILAGTLLLQINQLYHCHLKRAKKLKLLHRIIEILPLSPSQLAHKLAKCGGAELLQICKGSVSAGEPTTSILNSAKRILYSKLYGAEIVLGPQPKKRLLQTKEPSFLKVIDHSQSINIYESHRSIIVPTKLITLSEGQNILQQLKRKFKGIFTPETRESFSDLNYASFGSENFQELYVPDPSECAILGKFRKEAAEVCCYEPMLVAPSKQRMVALIQEDLAGDQVQRVVLVLILVGTVGLMLKEAWSLYQRYRRRPEGLLGGLKRIFVKSRVCSVCKNNLSCMLSQSCLHMAVCQECWPAQKEVCVQCSRRGKETVEMFVC